MEAKYRQAYNKIKPAENILIITHVRPDGDALSSLGTMADLMEKSDKKYTAFCADKPEGLFSFLPHFEKIISGKDNINFKDFDLIIVLDCGSLSRTGLEEEIKNKNEGQFIIEFDHHPKIDSYAQIEIKIPAATSTAEVLYRFLKANRIRITKNMANCILTGILTDTSNFLHQSTSEEAVTIASEMLIHGAQFPAIMRHTWQNKSLTAMKLWGRALSSLVINEKYNLAFAVLSIKETGKFKDEEDVFDGISTFLGNLYGVKAVMLLREEITPEGKKQIKGSIRSSHPEVDVSRLATRLGGGGHAKASGFIIEGELEKTANGWRVK
ncbi:hypothetical protein COV49_03225 [Candidatus Falkowbacteria bacterium CG11_big_fil_rev_8_21_14_0_20_39_10]|uniref:DHH family phosphoesterase n=1 Tax=Candidatus Falkowbacteria bacterium CG11_big_fil_rev_8_21_14_0_20_39_10 TaxID=1974570 RepID=A0A2M6K8J2_9BACT|nr:MAG: hypothetical protein COV49_03225 [Candidatus Falkowbacteria bacterium CG11_big_fil_rev_8_21_14_0_20_39_10]